MGSASDLIASQGFQKQTRTMVCLGIRPIHRLVFCTKSLGLCALYFPLPLMSQIRAFLNISLSLCSNQ